MNTLTHIPQSQKRIKTALKQLKKNAVKTHIKFQQRQVEAVDLRRRKQVGLKAFPECHNRGAIAYVRGQGVP